MRIQYLIIILGISLIASGCVKQTAEVSNTDSEQPVVNSQESMTEENSKTIEQKSKNLEEVDTSDPSMDEASWQTYRNEDLGVEFKLPKDWEQRNQQISNRIEFKKGGINQPEGTELLDGAIFSINLMQSVTSLEEGVIKATEDILNDGDNFTKEELHFKQEDVSVGGESAAMLVYKGTYGSEVIDFVLTRTIILEHNEEVLNIYCFSSGANKEAYMQVINEIISTFKFIEN
ncbi:MAG: PsbP-related protein [bacterium]|nr:PsbP-related protein [bacterium]